MKKTILFLLFSALFGLLLNAQNDTMYVMKNGVIVGRYNVNNQIDSLIYYNPLRGTFKDSRDGNTYNWVKIGNQVWMAENLKYLPSVVGPETGSDFNPYYYVYNYSGTNIIEAKNTFNYNTYGVLYNWLAAMAGSPSSSTNPSGVQGVCPSGWHLPSDAEWTQLITFLGGSDVAGGKLKATTLWNSPNIGATNESSFTSLPGGYRTIGATIFLGQFAYWWSTTEYGDLDKWCFQMIYNNSYVYRIFRVKQQGLSVRCVKN